MKCTIIHIKYYLVYLILTGFVSKNDLSAFDTLNKFLENNEIQSNFNISTDILEHLQSLWGHGVAE